MYRLRYPVAFIGILSIALALLSCGSRPKEPGRFYAEDLEFSIVFPDGWEIEIEPTGDIISAVCPLDDEDDMLYETISVGVEDMVFKIDLDEYFSAVRRTAKTDFAWFNEEYVEDVMIGEIRAKKTLFSYEEQGETVWTLGYCFVKGSRAYLITCISDDYSYDYYAAEFESSAESFRFE